MGGQQRGKHTILGVSIKNSRSSIVAKFRAGFISHSGLKIEREISHIFEIRNFPQRNIPVAKISPLLYIVLCMPKIPGAGPFPLRFWVLKHVMCCVFCPFPWRQHKTFSHLVQSVEESVVRDQQAVVHPWRY